jgi:acyl-CoA thioester hydrolase
MHTTQIRVIYGDCDPMGVVYYANYLRYFEIGRGELMRSREHTYREVEEGGLLLPVTEAHCRYLLPARYDDLLQLETRIIRARGPRVCFAYRLERTPGVLVASGTTEHAVLNSAGRPTRLPPQLVELLAPEQT